MTVNVSSFSTPRQDNLTICPVCLQLSKVQGICDDCEQRAELATLLRQTGGVVVPALPLFMKGHAQQLPLSFRVLAILEEQGAVMGWMRPDCREIANILGAKYNTVYHALRRLQEMGWVERRNIGTKHPRFGPDYRIALQASN